MTKPASLRSALFIAFVLSFAVVSRPEGQVPAAQFGSITGRVTDEHGAPIDRVDVHASSRLPDGTVDSAGFATTNEEGVYVIERARAGQVMVGVTVFTRSAQLPAGQTVAPRAIATSRGRSSAVVDRDGRTFQSITGPTWIENGRTVPYATTYFGGSRTMSGATPVEVVENQRTSGIDLQLIRARTFRVSGEVSGLNGPVAAAEVRLFAEAPVFGVYNTFGTPMTALAYTDELGRFTFLSVPDGAYSVTVAGSRNLAVGVTAEDVPYVRVSDVVSNTLREALPDTTLVVDSDHTDVRLMLKPKVGVHGTIVAPRPRPAMSVVRPVVQLLLGSESTPVRVPGLMPLRIDVVPGSHRFSVINVPGNWSVIRVMLNGRDMTGQPIEIGPDGLDGLQVTIGDPAMDSGPVIVSGPATRVIVGPNGAALPPGLTLPPGAVRVPAPLGTISGTVTDAEGGPVAGMGVSVFRMLARNGIEELIRLANGAVTDNNGRYRIEGIPTGANYVAATYPAPLGLPGGKPPTATLPSTVDQDGVRRGYVTTYYPGVTRRSEARSVTLVRGEEKSGIDIALARVPLVDVHGVVEGAAGRGRVSVWPASPQEQLSGLTLRRAEFGPDGSFRVVDLPHGEYVLTCMAGSMWARTTLFVDGPQAATVRLTLAASFTVSGRLSIEPPDDPSATPPPSTIRLSLEAQPRIGSPLLTAAVSPTGEFTFRNVPGGHYVLRAAVTGAWFQRAGVIASENTLVRPVEITADVSDASVVIASRPR